MSKDNLRFSERIRNARWRITRDETGDDIIILTKRNKADHIYPLSSERFGVWLTSGKINRLVDRLKKCAGCIIEQKGDSEAVLSWPYESLDAVAKILHPAKKRSISHKTKQHLNDISPFSRPKTSRTGREYEPMMDELGDRDS